MAKIQDLTLLSDIFPTGYHAAIQAGVTTVDRISGRRWARGPCLRGVLPSAGRGRSHRGRYDSGTPDTGQEFWLRNS